MTDELHGPSIEDGDVHVQLPGADDPDAVTFSTLNADGSVSTTRVIRHSDIEACPHYILDADHYREDGRCRCDDPDSTVMAEWGYAWKDGRWE